MVRRLIRVAPKNENRRRDVQLIYEDVAFQMDEDEETELETGNESGHSEGNNGHDELFSDPLIA